MKDSKIEWTDDTDNPIRTKDGSFYCVKVSEACKDCYAEAMARRLSFMRGVKPVPYKQMKTPPELVLERSILDGWAKKTKPRKRFVTSMTDIAGEFVPDAWFFEIMDAMWAAPLQTFQTLTKRHVNFHRLVHEWLALRDLKMLPDNIWPGMTTENQRRADERLPYLMMIPSRHRWISAEPLGTPLDLTKWLDGGTDDPKLAWVVTGGMSGHNAVPSHPDWFRSLRDQCADYGVSFFFKQWGEWHPERLTGQKARGTWMMPNGLVLKAPYHDPMPSTAIQMYRVGKHNAGAVLDGHTWKDFPSPFNNVS